MKGRVSRHDGPINGKISIFNSGPFGLRFIGQQPPAFILKIMFDGLKTNGVIPSSIFYTKFKEKEKTKNRFWRVLCFLFRM
jgi:hypothetical protein